MHRHCHNGLVYYTFSALDAYPALIHAVTTRFGGVSRGRFAALNLSRTVGDDPAAVEENTRLVGEALGICPADLVWPYQRHTANVHRVVESDRGRVIPDTDVLLTSEPGVPLLMRYADCTPVVIYDPRHHAVALVHSGWRGTVQGAVRAAVQAMQREFASQPGELVAGIGPSIGPCCYEVGAEVTEAVQAVFANAGALLPPGPRNGRRHFDLWSANRHWLVDAGVGRIEASELCTACRRAEFYSYRAEGGHTGHFAAIVMLQPRPGLHG